MVRTQVVLVQIEYTLADLPPAIVAAESRHHVTCQSPQTASRLVWYRRASLARGIKQGVTLLQRDFWPQSCDLSSAVQKFLSHGLVQVVGRIHQRHRQGLHFMQCILEGRQCQHLATDRH